MSDEREKREKREKFLDKLFKVSVFRPIRRPITIEPFHELPGMTEIAKDADGRMIAIYGDEMKVVMSKLAVANVKDETEHKSK